MIIFNIKNYFIFIFFRNIYIIKDIIYIEFDEIFYILDLIYNFDDNKYFLIMNIIIIFNK